jgi:hypothetical protein
MIKLMNLGFIFEHRDLFSSSPLLRDRRSSHLISVPACYAQASNNDRNNDRHDDLDSKLIITERNRPRMRLVIESSRITGLYRRTASSDHHHQMLT